MRMMSQKKPHQLHLLPLAPMPPPHPHPHLHHPIAAETTAAKLVIIAGGATTEASSTTTIITIVVVATTVAAAVLAGAVGVVDLIAEVVIVAARAPAKGGGTQVARHAQEVAQTIMKKEIVWSLKTSLVVVEGLTPIIIIISLDSLQAQEVGVMTIGGILTTMRTEM
jgi:hypothetical protein